MSPRTATVILASAALLAVASVGGDADARRTRHHSDEYWKARAEMYEAAYAELSDGLDRIERLNDRRRSRRAQRMIQRTIERTRDRARDYLVEDDRVAVEPDAMHRSDFARLRRSVGDASFTRERLRLVEAAAEHNFFTVDQVIVLVRLADFESSKIDMAAALYPRVIDVTDWYRVYDALSFESSKKKLRRRIGKLGDSQY